MTPQNEIDVQSQRDMLKFELMKRVLNIIDENKWTQVEAAKLLGVNQPRISNLKNGLAHKFSIDMLITMLIRINVPVKIIDNDGPKLKVVAA